MKKALALSLLVSVAAGASAQQSQPAAPAGGATASPASQEALNVARYKMALTDARRKLFAAGMSDLTPQQL
jgi:hypothetical protein